MLPFLADLVDADLGAVLIGGGVIDMRAGADDFRMADFVGRASRGGGTRRGGSTTAASKDTCESFFFSFGSMMGIGAYNNDSRYYHIHHQKAVV